MDQFSSLDLLALVIFGIATVGYGLFTSLPSVARRSVAGAMQSYRQRWMQNMARRDNRIVDAQLLGALSQGNAFFASSSAIAIGGLAAMTGSGDKAIEFLSRIPFAAKTSPLLWEFKIVLLIAVFVYAFFKFAWAFRLSHYTAIMIGAAPMHDDPEPAELTDHAGRTAALIGIAAEHANSGLRSFYYAMAAMAWFFHPLAFIAVTTWVVLILARRDFFSRARATVAGIGFARETAPVRDDNP